MKVILAAALAYSVSATELQRWKKESLGGTGNGRWKTQSAEIVDEPTVSEPIGDITVDGGSGTIVGGPTVLSSFSKYYPTIDLADDFINVDVQEKGIYMLPNQFVYLQADENLTTGYEWIQEPEVCDGVISVDLQSESEASKANIIGQAVGVGECTLRLAYARSWEFDWETAPDQYAELIEIPITVYW